MTASSSNSKNKIRINFNEPIPDMIERLKKEHRSFELKLNEADNSINRDNNTEVGIRIIRDMDNSVIRHAVEEEARLMRVIMQNAKDDSAESIKIMQEHNYVLNFFKEKLVSVENAKPSYVKPLQGGEEYTQAKSVLNEFIINLRSHFKEEEQVVFPLALKANLP
jgi:iron-sulfur cluster repair protein YtfE (RIC family)